MVTRSGFKRPVSRGLAAAWFLAAAGIAGVLVSSGCGKVSSTPVEPGAVDKGVISLRIEPAASSVAPGKTIDIAVSVSDAGGFPVKDGTMVSLLNDALGVITPTAVPTSNGTAHASFLAGTTTGISTIKASTGGVTQTTTVRIDPGAAPPPPPPSDGGTEPIDLSKVIWVNGPDISKYPKNASIDSVSIEAPYNVCSKGIKYPSNWPPMDNKPGNANANHLVFANIDGQWYAGCWEALFANTASCRPMETMRDGTTSLGPFGQVERDPFMDWYPRKGEQIGFMVTSWVRNSVPRGATGRSNVVMTTWPW